MPEQLTVHPSPASFVLSRRRLLALMAGVPLLGAECRAGPGAGREDQDSAGSRVTLRARPGVPARVTAPGRYPLGLSGERDGFLYVPTSYRPERGAPLLVLLHGAGQSAELWSSAALRALLDAAGIVALVPESRGATWDAVREGFGPDVTFLDQALGAVFARCRIDPAHVALGGLSDGASYALSLGVANGDLFGALIAFSPGFFVPPGRRGTPRVFVSHGRQDGVLGIGQTSRRIVPELRALGYPVRYDEFDGGHAMPHEVVEAAVRWFVPADP